MEESIKKRGGKHTRIVKDNDTEDAMSELRPKRQEGTHHVGVCDRET